MKTLTTFVNENKIKMDVKRTDENKLNKEWKNANHYKVTLKYNVYQLTTYFSQGYGIDRDPNTEDVLNALASDSSMVENAGSFEGWANELGYDTDSRKAEKIYKVCIKQAEKLKSFLGDDKYQELLYNTESL